jgi:hypothetical protein
MPYSEIDSAHRAAPYERGGVAVLALLFVVLIVVLTVAVT